MTAFGGLYAGRRVLVTGHTGFKGSWLVLWLRSLGAQVVGLALDPDTQPSHWAALQLADVADYRVDLRDAQAVNNVLQHHQPEIIFIWQHSPWCGAVTVSRWPLLLPM